MLFSYKLLSQIVDLSDITLEKVVDRLTFSGLEVEGVEKLASASNIVIGKILTCTAHPDSDHLHLLTVDCGNEGIKNIVCGAPNARVGIKVIVALPGCVLPALDVTIKKGTIRGYESEGMCCSLSELGVNKEMLTDKQLAGIEELPDDAIVGNKKVLEYLGLDDASLDINVLPNRPDLLSYYGMARELASLFGRKIIEPSRFDKSIISKKLSPVTKTDKCSRIDILTVKDIVLKEKTPEYIQKFLIASGIRPVSPIVDLGNYAMLLSGQPFNMYDQDKNPSDEYIVVDDQDCEFVTFDERKVKLIPGDLVISNGKENMVIAGVMAGKSACIDANTKNIAIEAAIFYHANIRHTCARLGLSSFSSTLFCKERNPLMIDESLGILISLFDEFFSSYKIEGYGVDNKVDENLDRSFAFSLDALNKRLGSSYTMDEVNKVLDAYRIKYDGKRVYPPIDRVDLKEQCDIEEEVFRYYDASKINPSLVNFPLTSGKLTTSQALLRDVRNLLVSRDFYDVLSYTLIDEKMDSTIRVFSKDPSYKILNPMTKDHEYVRSDILPSLLAVVDYNISHDHKDLRLFETSNVDTKNGSFEYLSIALVGKEYSADLMVNKEYDFFDMKGIVVAILSKIGLSDSRYRIEYSKNEAFHPKASADIYVGKDLVGTFGYLHPAIRKDRVVVAELNLTYLFNLKGLKTKFVPFSASHYVRRDLSFKLNDNITYQQIKKTILSIKDTYIKDVQIFDDFVDKISGEKYLGVALFMCKDNETLKDQEINASLDKVISTVKINLSLKLRGE